MLFEEEKDYGEELRRRFIREGGKRRSALPNLPPNLPKKSRMIEGVVINTNPSGGSSVVLGKKKKRKTKKRKLNTKQKVRKLQKSVKKLARLTPKFSTLIYRFTDVFAIQAPVNTKNMQVIFAQNKATIAAILDSVPILNPGTNAETSVDLSNAPLIRGKIKISENVRVRIKNNSTGAADVWLYVFTVNHDGDSDTDFLINEGWGHMTGIIPSSGGGTRPNVFYFPSDSGSNLKNYWDIKKHTHFQLGTGQEFNEYFKINATWDDAFQEEHKESNQKKLGAYQVLVLSQGTVCHDATNKLNVGYANHQLDCVQEREYKIRYDSVGPQTKWHRFTHTFGNITTGSAGGMDVQMENMTS